ncbi:MAG: hypothetical protein M0Z76_00050 [Gammaproteobacteria bacterium]|nr:hypothetical protein [Gammaproteobacteria bacterium]
MRRITASLGAILCLAAAPAATSAHAIVGMRVFPGTLTFSDPGITDELDLTLARAPVGQSAVDTSIWSLSYSKTLTHRLGLSVGTDYQSPGGANGPRGLDDLNIGLQDLLWISDSAETLITGGLSATIGGSGSTAIGAPYSTISPTLLFGRGLGDLPGTLRYLRPAAITGAVTPNIALSAGASDTVDYGLSFQYSLPYLQNFVRDIGLHAPFNNLVPLVELPMQTCTSGPCAGQTRGTIDPGFVWIGHYGQVGLEAMLPMNRASGRGIGFLLGVGFYMDDVFPHSLGAPIFRNTPPA